MSAAPLNASGYPESAYLVGYVAAFIERARRLCKERKTRELQLALDDLAKVIELSPELQEAVDRAGREWALREPRR